MMNDEFGSVFLFSQDRLRLCDFLSEVLDFELDIESQRACRGPFTFDIKDSLSSHPSTAASSESIAFSFQVKRLEDLDIFSNKFNFFLYRKGQNSSMVERIEVQLLKTKKVLNFYDIDNRLWRFEAMIPCENQ